LACGAGIRKGKLIEMVDNIDLAATLANLLGVPFQADGKVISGALQE